MQQEPCNDLINRQRKLKYKEEDDAMCGLTPFVDRTNGNSLAESAIFLLDLKQIPLATLVFLTHIRRFDTPNKKEGICRARQH